MNSTLFIAGRVLIASYFIFSGARHFWVYPDVVAKMQARGLPLPAVALALGTAFEIIAGGMLAAGWYLPYVTTGLVVFTLASSAIAMDFWNQDGKDRAVSINGWLANVAVIGGLCVIAAVASA